MSFARNAIIRISIAGMTPVCSWRGVLMAELQTGTVTFLFTDIEGSTKRWEQYPQQMQSALERHDYILRTSIEANNGYVFKTVGDAFCAAFPTALDALAAALAAHSALQAEPWNDAG